MRKPFVLAAFSLAALAAVSCGNGPVAQCPTPPTEGYPEFQVRLSNDDGPITFCNPLDLVVDNQTARRGGEPVVITFEDTYYLFVSHGKEYWYSDNFRDWTYVSAPNYPGGVVSVVEIEGKLYGCSMNNYNVYTTDDPKSGVWYQCGTLDSNRYGDANMFYDDGHLYMFYGWSQLMCFKVVELDPKTFKEIGEPNTLFFSDINNHGFETRWAHDNIYSIFNGYRDYFPEELPWIEGPYVVKHNGKYYLQYAAIGLEFLSYSHGVYVADHPMGPYTYSESNPLTFKVTGYQVGAGHGSTFHDKNGQLWTICMIPSSYGPGRGSSELAIYPTAVDEDGIMHSNYELGDYPQYYPGVKKDAVYNNYTGWALLSKGKNVIVSSQKDLNHRGALGVDENFMTCWAAATGDPGEFYTVDLGQNCTVNAIQVNIDKVDPTPVAMPAGMGGMRNMAPATYPDQYQSYIIEVSQDNKTWTKIVDFSKNGQDFRHRYFELKDGVQARYVKVTNCFTPDGKFAIKDLRIFGNQDVAKYTKVTDLKAVRNKEDRRIASLIWEPVEGADAYIIRYGIAPDKLYNSYIVYGYETHFTMYSLNTAPEYYFEVEAIDNGTESHKENYAATMGRGAEIQLARGRGRGGYSAADWRQMVVEGVNEYVFDNIEPGDYTFSHTYGPVLWEGTLTEKELIGNGGPTVEAFCTELGVGTKVTGHMELKVVPGEKAGKIVITTVYDK